MRGQDVALAPAVATQYQESGEKAAQEGVLLADDAAVADAVTSVEREARELADEHALWRHVQGGVDAEHDLSLGQFARRDQADVVGVSSRLECLAADGLLQGARRDHSRRFISFFGQRCHVEVFGDSV